MMRSFFARPDAAWRSFEGALHFYALPGPHDDVISEHRHVSRSLSDFTGLAVQPVEFLHVTLQRLDLYEQELPAEWEKAMARLTQTLRSMSPFDLKFAAPVVTDDAVEARAQPTPEWRSLLGALRNAVIEGGVRSALTAEPPGPHYSHAYCRDDRPSAPVREAVDRVGRPTTMTLTGVALVGVTQERETGVFSFDTMRTWRLGPEQV